MKSMANSDFSVIIEKLPIALRYARSAVPPSDLYAINAIRRLSMVHRKLISKQPIKPKHHDKK